MSPFPPDVREAIEQGGLKPEMAAHLADRPHTGPTPHDEVPEDFFYDIDIEAELAALYADGVDLWGARTNRAQRRRDARNRTVFETSWRGSRRRWKSTQTPTPIRIAVRRRRNKAARASRKANR